ncbi:hypothetical protein [Rhodococcus tukisamuensis]|uniref:Aromatic ring-opening dioxygenase, LigB subunit n=1 Tax=Rhodococcus tukisamuensis TaxID=168276 RepID=A0A1G6R4S7_9NOCA|nr:hypothetical protein [Rhodococcus tukisamuensis]SDC98916.1 hypothetical protein SAMN05444580_102308 [Rhodococcus tukisamuensis]
MFTAAALVSAPPLLIPELAGAAAAETADLRAASLAVAARLRELAPHWTVVGVGATEAELGPDTSGSFAGFGADVRVALSPDAAASSRRDLPLAVLVAGWLRAHAAPDAAAHAIVVAADTSPVYCAEVGARLRARLDAAAEPHGVLVVADGATTLTAKAPGAFDDRAPGAQAELDAALTAGDLEFLRQLDPVACADLGIEGRAAWQVLAGLFGDDAPRCRTDYQGAPYGVGYHVGTWER